MRYSVLMEEDNTFSQFSVGFCWSFSIDLHTYNINRTLGGAFNHTLSDIIDISGLGQQLIVIILL